MQKLYLILLILILILSLFFGVLIWRQTIKVEKRALAAKQAKEEFLNRLQREREEEERKIAEEQRRQEEEQRRQEEEQRQQEEEQLEGHSPADNINPDTENNPSPDFEDKQ